MSQQIIERFYQAFQEHNAAEMALCYHPEVVFNDPVFKNLNHEQVCGMWAMLLERSKGELVIAFHSTIADDTLGQCIWEADYFFSQTRRPVHNIIHATMEFKDGLIIRHDDRFDFWRWSRMALGIPGILLGWSPIIKNKVQKMARKSLDSFLKQA